MPTRCTQPASCGGGATASPRLLASRTGSTKERPGCARCRVAVATMLPAAAAAAIVLTMSVQHVGSPPLAAVLVFAPLALAEPISGLVGIGDASADTEVAAARLFALLDRPAPVADHGDPASRIASDARAMLDDVALRWPSAARDAVRHCTLVVEPGARVLLSGPNGSGKSTVAAALVRFLEPVAGRYTLGGRPASSLSADRVREHVTWCEQDPWLSAGSLRDNLQLAAPTAGDAELWSALGDAGLAGWASALADGLDTPVGTNGVEMSGGQRQRLAVARTLLRHAKIIVLDEPAAHLDDRSARDLVDRLETRTDLGLLVIDHDDSTRWHTDDVVRLVAPTDDSAELRTGVGMADRVCQSDAGSVRSSPVGGGVTRRAGR